MTMFKSLGVHFVFDTTFSRDLALIERLGGPTQCTCDYFSTFCHAIVFPPFLCCSASGKEFVHRFRSRDSPGNVPMLASACPGKKYHSILSPSYVACTHSVCLSLHGIILEKGNIPP